MKDVKRGSERDKIMRVLHDADVAIGPKDVHDRALEMGFDLNYDSIRGTISQMAKEDILKKEGRGLYTLPDSFEDTAAAKSEGESLSTLVQQTVRIRIHTEARVGVGDGHVVYPDGATHSVEVPWRLLAEVIGIQLPRRIGVMWADGDSMEPTIKNEELVIYQPVDKIQGAGVYVVYLTHGLSVRRVQPMADGGFRIISDNDSHAYDDEVLVPTEDGFMKESTGRSAEFYPAGKVLFPGRKTNQIYVSQMDEIVKRAMNSGEVLER